MLARVVTTTTPDHQQTYSVGVLMPAIAPLSTAVDEGEGASLPLGDEGEVPSPLPGDEGELAAVAEALAVDEGVAESMAVDPLMPKPEYPSKPLETLIDNVDTLFDVVKPVAADEGENNSYENSAAADEGENNSYDSAAADEGEGKSMLYDEGEEGESAWDGDGMSTEMIVLIVVVVLLVLVLFYYRRSIMRAMNGNGRAITGEMSPASWFGSSTQPLKIIITHQGQAHTIGTPRNSVTSISQLPTAITDACEASGFPEISSLSVVDMCNEKKASLYYEGSNGRVLPVSGTTTLPDLLEAKSIRVSVL